MSDETHQKVQLGLFVATLSAIILGSIPPLSFVGSLAVRSITCLSLLVFGYHTLPQQTSLLGKASIVFQVAAGILGLVAIATFSPALMIASLAMDIAHRAIEMKRSYEAKNWTSFAFHACFLAIDVLGISAIATGSWQLLFAAAICNLVAIVAFITIHMIQARQGGTEFISKETLAIGLMSAISSLTMTQVFTKS